MYLNADQVVDLFNSLDKGEVYRKTGEMLARPASPGETVITIVSGAIETLKGTNQGDWVIRNIVVGSSAEMYPISDESFDGRYEVLEDEAPWIVDGNSWYRVKPTGQIIGGFYDLDTARDMEWISSDSDHARAPTVKFEAPWGSDMILEDGDFLGSPYPEVDLTNIYRVARREFFQTYGDTPEFRLRDSKVDKRELVA